MEKQKFWCSEQNNYSNRPLPPGGVLPHTLCLRKKLCHSENIMIFLLNNTYSLSTGPTVLISYTTVMFYKTTSFKTLFFLLLKMRWFTVKSVFSPVHHQCKLHGENFYTTLVNIVYRYNQNWSWLYLVVILGETVGGGGLPHSTLIYFCDQNCIFSIITPVFSVTWSSEIILICWFAAQETFLTITGNHDTFLQDCIRESIRLSGLSLLITFIFAEFAMNRPVVCIFTLWDHECWMHNRLPI